MTDAVSRLIDFHLCAGQAGDIRFEIPQRSRLPVPDHQLADTTYDDDAFRAFLIGREAVPVIRPNPTRSGSQHSTKRALQAKECRRTLLLTLKDWRRVATRCDKLARNFAASVARADILIWWT